MGARPSTCPRSPTCSRTSSPTKRIVSNPALVPEKPDQVNTVHIDEIYHDIGIQCAASSPPSSPSATTCSAGPSVSTSPGTTRTSSASARPSTFPRSPTCSRTSSPPRRIVTNPDLIPEKPDHVSTLHIDEIYHDIGIQCAASSPQSSPSATACSAGPSASTSPGTTRTSLAPARSSTCPRSPTCSRTSSPPRRTVSNPDPIQEKPDQVNTFHIGEIYHVTGEGDDDKSLPTSSPELTMIFDELASSSDLKMILESINLMSDEISSMNSKNENNFTMIKNQMEFQQNQDIIKEQQSEMQNKQNEMKSLQAEITIMKNRDHLPRDLSS